MNDCISRAALLDAFDEMEPAEEYEFEHGMWLDLRLEVINAPTVTPDVPHGRWINSYVSGVHHYRCSECGEYTEAVWHSNFVYRFCPNCGARMDGDTND